jgi:hypothetical protein
MYYKKCTTHSSCRNLICNQKIHFKGDGNTKNNVEMDFLGAFFGALYYAFARSIYN